MIFAITVERTIVFSLILAIGFAVAKTAIIKREFMPDPAQLITKVLLPVMISYSTCENCTR